MGYYFVASPYSHENPEIENLRYQGAMSFCVQMQKHGLPVFSPVMYWHHAANIYNLPKDSPYWVDFNRHMIFSSLGILVLMLPGWDTSTGVQGERDYAGQIGKEIAYFHPLDEDLHAWRRIK